MKNRKTFFLSGKPVLMFLLMLAAGCAGRQESVRDIDGNVYRTVMIGKKIWMAENLRVTKYRNGEPIPEVRADGEWAALASGARCSYDNSPRLTMANGCLYNWHAVNDPRGLAPEGWHVATDEEWSALAAELGGDDAAGAAIKASGKWGSAVSRADNPSGFDALPSGARRDTDGVFVLLGEYARFWSSTASDASKAFGRAVGFYDGALRRGEVSKRIGFSVRCVKD